MARNLSPELRDEVWAADVKLGVFRVLTTRSQEETTKQTRKRCQRHSPRQPAVGAWGGEGTGG